MRSTEASGVEVGGVTRRAARDVTLYQRLRTFAASIAIVSYAVAFGALLAATLFVVIDVTRSFDDLRLRNALIARLSATQPLAAQLTASLAPVLGETDAGQATTKIAERGAAAYGLAFLFIGCGFRRRRKTATIPAPNIIADLLATIPFGVACWSGDGRLLVCNDQYRARLNADPIETRIGASYLLSLQRLIEGGYMRLVSEDERSRTLELHREDGSCLLIDERPLIEGGFVTLVTDVTESRRTDHLLSSIREEQRVLARRYHEEKLRAEAASRSKTSFLAHLSHDIRTPLNHIIGFAELMRQQTYGPLGDARYANYVESIRGSGERLLTFFASILDLAELESGRRVLETDELGVDELLSSVTRRFSAQAQQARVTLALGAPCGAMLLGDRFSLERMLGNIVDNAIRFTPAGGRVNVAAHAGSDGVVLEVTDTGIGMGPDRLATLSQPFAFGDAALTKAHEGAGLGLAIARTIVELSGGRLAIDSRPGLGTTVAVSLPLPSAVRRIEAAA